MAGARRLGPEERREQILSAAICHFAEVGLAGTTRDVAARAGVTQALLYRYFASKAELLEAVFQRVFLGRLDPGWQEAIRDRGVPLRERLVRFYTAYTAAIFTPEWMRIFVWAGLAGEALNRRYFERLGETLLAPLREEVAAEPGLAPPDMEAMWGLHGQIVYLGIRRFIYRLPTPDDAGPAIARAVDGFLATLTAPTRSSPPP